MAVKHNSCRIQIALRLTRLLTKSNNYSITSIIRRSQHITSLKSISPNVSPVVLSLEEASVSEFAKVFTGTDVVVFAAGAGGSRWLERTKTVDYLGAVKVFDAIEAVEGNKPRLIVVGSLDARDPSVDPPHYVS